MPTRTHRLYWSFIPSRHIYIYVDIICVLFSYTHDTPPRAQLETEKKYGMYLFYLHTWHAHLELNFETRKFKTYVSFLATRMSRPWEINFKLKRNKVCSLRLNVFIALLYLVGIYILISYVSFLATRMTRPLELNLKKRKKGMHLFDLNTWHAHLELNFETRKFKIYMSF